MKALVTGDRGFVGRHFVKFLKERDWEVFGLDWLNGRDEDAYQYFQFNRDEQFDLLVHCAYDVGGRSRIGSVNVALNRNISMDASMFEWAINGGTRAVLYFSSSAAYPVRYQTPEFDIQLNEGLIYLDDIQQPDADYGWAKITGERLARNAADLGVRVHIVRPFSGYGSDQGLEYPFPSIVKRVKESKLEVWGPPGQTRDWIHIDDVVAGAFEMYQQDVRTAVNLCTGRPTEMGELARMVLGEKSGYGGLRPVEEIVTYSPDKPTGVFYRVGDPEKMSRFYQPKVSLEEGIQRALKGV